MKLTLLICFFGLLAFVSSIALPSKLRRQTRLEWLRRGRHLHNINRGNQAIPTLPTLPTAVPSSTPYPYYQSTPGYTGYPWYTASTSYPWYDGTTTNTGYPWYGSSTTNTGYPWYGSSTTNSYYRSTTNWWNSGTTPWYPNPTPSSPWNYGTTANPWNYPTTPSDWMTTTPGYWRTTTTWSPTRNTPNPSNMCPYGAVASMSKTQCFQLFFGNMTFIEAEMDCQSRKGHLASVHNAFDNMILNDYARNMIGSSSQYYIGANDLTNKQWAWTDGSYFDYADWYTYQGGNAYSDCALVDTSHGAWIRSDCYSRAYYACTVPAYPY